MAVRRPTPAADAPRANDPQHADPAGFKPVARGIRRRSRHWTLVEAWDASRGGGLQRKAVVGQLNEVGGVLAPPDPQPGASPPTSPYSRAGCPTSISLEPTAQKYFVVAAHAAPGRRRPATRR
ncbi:Regulatory protein OS=Streptomyces microflavus OX=1919 GN=Smic_82040 PE=4 SV=1 [Streptomyces microflavus]